MVFGERRSSSSANALGSTVYCSDTTAQSPRVRNSSAAIDQSFTQPVPVPTMITTCSRSKPPARRSSRTARFAASSIGSVAERPT